MNRFRLVPLPLRAARPLALIAWCLALAGPPARGQRPPDNGGDSFRPALVVGSDACAKCHAAEVQTWRASRHAQTYDSLHRKPEAKAITDRLGLRSVKRNDTCVRCHYTRKEVGGRVRVDSGVSCESCHGPAAAWIESHADYGPGATRLTESPEHRLARRLAAIDAGMNNPANLYLVARQCLDCHTAPDERLVDVGLHPPGTPGFDLVAYSQGSIRHNFVRSDGAFNEPSGPERLRVMYVVGLMADLEYSLRAVSEATSAGAYGKAAAARAARAKQRLWEVQRRIESPLIAPALAAVGGVEPRLGAGEELRGAADAVGQAAYLFADGETGEGLGAIDDLLPPASSYK